MVQLINNFTLACVESHQNVKAQLECVCDFRINENNCLESYLLRTGSWILIPYASFIAVTSIIFLWYRIYYKGQSLLFPPSRERGIIRPRPHDAFHLVTLTFSILHVIRQIFLIRGAYSSSIWAEIVDDLPRQTSFSFSILYLVGIIYSIPTLEPARIDYYRRYIPNKYLIDIGATFLMIGPYIVNTPISYYIGYYADIEEIPLNSLLKYHMNDLKEISDKPNGDFTLQWKPQFIIIYKPTQSNAPFGRMMSVVRRPISTEMSSKSRSIQKIGFSSFSERPRSESPSSSKRSKRSKRTLPEIQTQTKSIIVHDDHPLPTPFTPYTSGWDELLFYDNLGDFLSGEIPIEQHQITHHRSDSSIDISSLASTTYFSTTQSVHSKNDSVSVYSFSNNSKRLTPINGTGTGNNEILNKSSNHSFSHY
ncbi:9974_t:CDS:2 [Rhizophagus irregularis]|nr:9974_t:CDS:2 [Rhizophagus irregularis]